MLANICERNYECWKESVIVQSVWFKEENGGHHKQDSQIHGQHCKQETRTPLPTKKNRLAVLVQLDVIL